MANMIYLSKSKYCAYWQCPKNAWLQRYKPEVQTVSDEANARMKIGSEVGALARGLFGPYTDVTVHRGDQLDLPGMIEATEKELSKQTPVICEASFSCDGLYCAVDILKREKDGWAIYEVKSSTNTEKPIYHADVAYQNYVLVRCGINVTGVYLVCLNNQYVYDGNLDLRQLFRIEDVTKEATAEKKTVEEQIAAARLLLATDEEPDIDLSERCEKPNNCPFWGYCTQTISAPSVFDLYRIPFKTALKYYHNGLISYEDLHSKARLNEKQQRQIIVNEFNY